MFWGVGQVHPICRKWWVMSAIFDADGRRNLIVIDTFISHFLVVHLLFWLLLIIYHCLSFEVWDDELAAIAKKWTDSCTLSRNEKIDIPGKYSVGTYGSFDPTLMASEIKFSGKKYYLIRSAAFNWSLEFVGLQINDKVTDSLPIADSTRWSQFSS